MQIIQPNFTFILNIILQFSIHFTYNSMQNVWNKLEKSSKTGQGKKSLISTFACFLIAAAEV